MADLVVSEKDRKREGEGGRKTQFTRDNLPTLHSTKSISCLGVVSHDNPLLEIFLFRFEPFKFPLPSTDLLQTASHSTKNVPLQVLAPQIT